MANLSKEKIQKRAKNIQKIYSDFLVQLEALNKKQQKIIKSFAKKLEKRKIEKIRKQLE